MALAFADVLIDVPIQWTKGSPSDVSVTTSYDDFETPIALTLESEEEINGTHCFASCTDLLVLFHCAHVPCPLWLFALNA